MKLMWIIAMVPVLFTSCGYVSKSAVHSRKEWNAYKNSPSQPLPVVTLKVGESKLAYKNRIGFPPMPGGFIPTLWAEDSDVVTTGMDMQWRGTDTHIIGIKPGATRMHLVNGLAMSEVDRQELEKRKDAIFTVNVTP